MGMLSSKMRDVLIDHLDGAAVPVVKIKISELGGLDASRAADRYITTRALILRGFLKYPSNRAKAPTHTLITEAGRAELGMLLGEYADALARARSLLPAAEDGDGEPPTRGQDRRRREAERPPVDIAAEAPILGGKILPRTEETADGGAGA